MTGAEFAERRKAEGYTWKTAAAKLFCHWRTVARIEAAKTETVKRKYLQLMGWV